MMIGTAEVTAICTSSEACKTSSRHTTISGVSIRLPAPNTDMANM